MVGLGALNDYTFDHKSAEISRKLICGFFQYLSESKIVMENFFS